MDKDKFRIRLKKLREENYFTQEKLGQLLNYEKQTVSNYENGIRVPDEYTFDRLSEIFNVDKAYLKGETDFLNNIDLSSEIINELIKHKIVEKDMPLSEKKKKSILIAIRNAIKTLSELDI